MPADNSQNATAAIGRKAAHHLIRKGVLNGLPADAE